MSSFSGYNPKYDDINASEINAESVRAATEVKSVPIVADVVADATLTGEQIVGGLITKSVVGAVTMTFPAASVILAAMGDSAKVGDVVELTVINTGGTAAFTVAVDTGATITAVGALAASGTAIGSTQKFLVRITADAGTTAAPTTPAADLYYLIV